MPQPLGHPPGGFSLLPAERCGCTTRSEGHSMKVLKAIQKDEVSDAVRAKFSMAAPVLEAMLNSLPRKRMGRLGGLDNISLHDLAREFREGTGDTGICFELAIHEAIAAKHNLIHPLVSEVLEKFCAIKDGADSILFGPEKNGVIPILESVRNALTDDSRVYVGGRGQPPKLKRHIPAIIRAFFRNERGDTLPRSISGLWKADLFVGGKDSDKWMGTTVKINAGSLQGAKGLRIGLYPEVNKKDVPRLDEELNLIRIPLPYEQGFMELFYKSFNLVRSFLRADACIPREIELPDSEDRFITQELQRRKDFAVMEILDVLRAMGQPDLLEEQHVTQIEPAASLSEAGLSHAPAKKDASEAVSLAPTSRTRK
jgi:hypothetical protein